MNLWKPTYDHFPNMLSRCLSLILSMEEFNAFVEGKFCAETELIVGKSETGAR